MVGDFKRILFLLWDGETSTVILHGSCGIRVKVFCKILNLFYFLVEMRFLAVVVVSYNYFRVKIEALIIMAFLCTNY